MQMPCKCPAKKWLKNVFANKRIFNIIEQTLKTRKSNNFIPYKSNNFIKESIILF